MLMATQVAKITPEIKRRALHASPTLERWGGCGTPDVLQMKDAVAVVFRGQQADWDGLLAGGLPSVFAGDRLIATHPDRRLRGRRLPDPDTHKCGG
jgi:hypothetical protein